MSNKNTIIQIAIISALIVLVLVFVIGKGKKTEDTKERSEFDVLVGICKLKRKKAGEKYYISTCEEQVARELRIKAPTRGVFGIDLSDVNIRNDWNWKLNRENLFKI